MATAEQLAQRLSPRQWERHRAAKYREMARALEGHAKDEAPVRSGRLRDDLEGVVTRSKTEPIKVRARSQQELLGWIVRGTPPHIIEASPGSALHWTEGGVDFFAKSVQHPGTQPNDFLSRAADNARDDMEAIMQEAAEEWLRAVSA